jgi:hypothetical protein
MNATDDQHARAGPGEMKDLDRPVLRRPPDDGGNG